MSTQTTTSVNVIAIIPGQGAQEVAVAPGTTVGQLATQLGIEGGERIAALDGMSNAIGANHVITEATEAVNFVFKLAGA